MTEYVLMEADIQLDKWDAAIDHMIATARRIKNLLKFDVQVNVSDSELTALQRKITDQTINIKTNITDDDLSRIKRQLDELDTTVKINTAFDIGDLRQTINTLGKLDTTADVKVNVADEDIKAAQGKIDNLDTTADVDVKVTGEKEVEDKLSNIESQLEGLHNLAKIELVLDAAEFIRGIQELPVISTLVEIDATVQTVRGRTERDIPKLGDMIDSLWTDAWGESKDEIGDVILRLGTLQDETGKYLIADENLLDAAEGAFQAAALTGEDQTMVIRAAAALVRNEYVGSFREAFDFISKGARAGLNANEDFLDSLEEYPARLTNANLSIQGLYNIIEQGAAAGARNTDNVVDAFAELFDLTKEEVNIFRKVGDETDRTRALIEAGLIDKATLFAQGKITGDEYGEAVIDALVAKAGDPESQDRLARAIFGPTFVEMAGLQNLLAIDLDRDVKYKGTAKEGADIMFDTFETAATEFGRTLQDAIVDALDNALGLKAMLERGKVAAQAFSKALKEGTSIGGALEVALQIPGLEHQIDVLSSTISNLLIGLLEVAANIGEFAGRDVSGLRDTIKDLTRGQLEFDLKTAQTVNEMTTALNTALERGFSEGELDAILAGVVGDVLEEKGVDAAQAFVDTLRQIENQPMTGTNNPIANLFASPLALVQPGLNAPATDAFQVIVDNYERETGRFTKAGDQTKKSLDDFAVAQGVAKESTHWWNTLDEQVNRPLIEMANQSTLSKDQVVKDFRAIQTGSGSFEVAKTNFNALATAILSQTGQMTSNLGNLANTLSLFSDAGSRALDVNASLTPPEGGGGSVATADVEANARGGLFSGASIVGERGPELITSNEKMAVLNNQTTENIWRALSGMGGAVTNNRTSNVTVNMIFNTASMAQAYGAGNAIADQVRGYAG